MFQSYFFLCFFQIRKQAEKEHAELIEEYRVKQQQQGSMQPAMIHGMPPMQPHGWHDASWAPNKPTYDGPMMPIRLHPGQPDATNVTNTAVAPWCTCSQWSTSNARSNARSSSAGTAYAAGSGEASQGQSGGESPHVNFDDTNPFSEGFQERERKERLWSSRREAKSATYEGGGKTAGETLHGATASP